MSTPLRRKVIRSPLAPLAALPLRASYVVRHNARSLRLSAAWLARSREHTNFTYDLSPLNRTHLAWFVAELTGSPVKEIRGYFDELETDTDLQASITEATAASPMRRLTDRGAKWHKRLGWYALTRALKPAHVVETGTDKGLGSLVFAAALLRNGTGRLTTIDNNPDSGFLIQGRYAEVVDREIGDSLAILARKHEPVDLFIHDSLHTREHEAAEFDAVAGHLTADALVLSDNAHVTDALPCWAEATDRHFAYWHERPEGHWYPGGGVGVAWR